MNYIPAQTENLIETDSKWHEQLYWFILILDL